MDPSIETPQWELTDVIVCGCGPTGAMLSAHLGRANVANICLDKEPDITTDPRGIGLDEDGIRAVQSLGIYDKLYSEIGRCMGVFNFISDTRYRLDKQPFLKMDYNTTEGGTGHVGFICHKQPVLENYLRQAMASTKTSQLRVGSTLTEITEDEHWVYVTYEDVDRTQHHLRAKFLVGADGKTGFTRKRYLEPKGIRLEQAFHTFYQEMWVAMNWKMKLPTPETHPNYPLWKCGYSPEQVYDSFFPNNFRFLCNPKRPAVCGRFGLPEDRLWRFEFVVQKDEDGTQMVQESAIRKIVHPYLTHPGSRYGVKEPVEYPDDCIEVLRASTFVFSARSCNKWALGRVILCGDSAHVFPPFGAQGITSGFRDACSLAWRLEVACRPEFKNYESLLTAWYMERKQQLERSLAATIENGKYVTEGNPIKIFIRNAYLWLLQCIPSWKRWLEKGARRDGMIRYTYESGMAFLPELGGGLCFPQVYCTSLNIVSEPIQIHFTDDIIFTPSKNGLLQLVVLVDKVGDLQTFKPVLNKIDKLSDGHVIASETTFIVHDPSAGIPTTSSQKTQPVRLELTDISVVRIATAAEFASSPLCLNRPDPQYYNEYRLRDEVGEANFVLLRQDRFVFAACKDEGELEHALGRVTEVLNGETL